MKFNSSLNKQESILALTQATKEQKVQELSLSVSRMSPDGVCVQAGDLEKERKKVVENNYLLNFHTWSPLDSYLDSSPDHYPGTSQADPLPFDILSTHAIDEREQESWHLKGETERRWRMKTKRCERLTSMRTIIGESRPYDRYDVRSRDFHKTDAHVS